MNPAVSQGVATKLIEEVEIQFFIRRWNNFENRLRYDIVLAKVCEHTFLKHSVCCHWRVGFAICRRKFKIFISVGGFCVFYRQMWRHTATGDEKLKARRTTVFQVSSEFLPLDKSVSSWAEFVILSGTEGNVFGASLILKYGKRYTIYVNGELTGTHRRAVKWTHPRSQRPSNPKTRCQKVPSFIFQPTGCQ